MAPFIQLWQHPVEHAAKHTLGVGEPCPAGQRNPALLLIQPLWITT